MDRWPRLECTCRNLANQADIIVQSALEYEPKYKKKRYLEPPMRQAPTKFRAGRPAVHDVWWAVIWLIGSLRSVYERMNSLREARVVR